MALKPRLNRKKNRKYVEIGRVVFIRFGKFRGTLAVITDVIDQNWILIDGRAFKRGAPRQTFNIKDIALTHLKVKMGHNVRHRTLKEKVAKADVQAEWDKTTQAQKVATQKAKKNSTDLERWRIMYNRRQRSWLIKAKYGKLKKKALQTAKRKFGPKNPVPYKDRKHPEKKDGKKRSAKCSGFEKRMRKQQKIDYKAIAAGAKDYVAKI